MEREIDKFITFTDMLTCDLFKYSKINKRITSIEIHESIFNHLEKYFHLLDERVEIIKGTDECSRVLKFIGKDETESHFTLFGFWLDDKDKSAYSVEYIGYETVKYAVENNIHINNGEIFIDYLSMIRNEELTEEIIYKEIRDGLLLSTTNQFKAGGYFEDKYINGLTDFRIITHIITLTDEEVLRLYLEKNEIFLRRYTSEQYSGNMEMICFDSFNYLINTDEHIIILEWDEEDEFDFNYYTVINKRNQVESFKFKGDEYTSTNEDLEVLKMLYSEEHYMEIPLLVATYEEEVSIYVDMKTLQDEYDELMLENYYDLEKEKRKQNLIYRISHTSKAVMELINKIKGLL